MKIFKGKVVATNMAKTATVLIERVTIHPIYGKRFKVARKYHVHDEIGARVGDVVKFVASKPYSKIKKWKILGVVSDKTKTPRKDKKS